MYSRCPRWFIKLVVNYEKIISAKSYEEKDG